jgi:hypothetical protein
VCACVPGLQGHVVSGRSRFRGRAQANMQNCEHGSAAPTVVLEGLPASQAGAARHKCVVCAFQRGQQGAIAAGAVERCGHGHSAPIEVLRAWTYPEVAPSSGMFPEGAQTVVTVNAYERSAAARAACIAHHGANCSACGMNFEQTYGPVGKGFIHVHHLKALASIGIEYNVDPVADLRPICPNCHAMLHRGEPMHSIEDLRTMLQSAQKSGPSQSR